MKAHSMMALVASVLVSLRSAAQVVSGFNEVENLTGPTQTLGFVGLQYEGGALKVSTFDGTSQSFTLDAPNVELSFKEGQVTVEGEAFTLPFGPNVYYVADVFGGAKIGWRGKEAEPGYSILDVLPPPEFTVNLTFSGPSEAIVWAVAPVPEPTTTAAAVGLGLLGFAAWRRSRN